MQSTPARSPIARKVRKAIRVLEGAHWEMQPRGKDGKWIYAGVKYNWADSNKGAAPYKAKIKNLEKLVGTGQIDAFLKSKPAFSANPNSYQKTLMQAWENLHAYVVENSLAEPKNAVPVPGASGVVAGWTKIGGQLGTEKGGTYIGPDGAKYYVKLPDSEVRARNEVLAGRLYQLAGGGVVDSSLVAVEGKVGVGTKWLEGSEKVAWLQPNCVKAYDDFAIHAWLANWDAVGHVSEMDNIKMQNGKLICVDTGGALDHRAMASSGKKPFPADAKEFYSLRDPNVNQSMAKVFGGMSPIALAQSASKLASLNSKDVSEIVDKFSGDGDNEKKMMTNTLMARRVSILKAAWNELDKAGYIDKEWEEKLTVVDGVWVPPVLLANELANKYGTSNPEEVSSIADVIKKVDPSPAVAPPKQTLAPTATVAPAVPPPPIVNSPTNPSVQKKLNEIYEAAKSGDASKVAAIKTNPDVKANYPKKIHAYKVAVLAVLGAGGIANADVVLPPAPHSNYVDVSGVTPEKIPPKPEPSIKQVPTHAKYIAAMAIPDFLSKKTGPENKVVANQIKAAAAIGDMKALEQLKAKAMLSPKLATFYGKVHDIASGKVDPMAVPTGKVTVDESGLKKLPFDKIGSGHEAIPVDATHEAIAKKTSLLVQAAKSIKADAISKVGHWNVLGSISASDVPDVPLGKWITNSALAKKLESTGLASHTKLTGGIGEAIRSYTGGAYQGMNSALRNATSPLDSSTRAAKAAKGIKQASHDLPTGMLISRYHFGAAAVSSKIKPGMVVSDKGILSTSMDPNVWKSRGDVFCEIVIGPGVKGLSANKFTKVGGEQEVLFPPGQRFMVLASPDNVKLEDVHGGSKTRLRLLALPSD
jgi:hypothetical protein